MAEKPIPAKKVADSKHFGSFAALARLCDCSREAARRWRVIPAEHCRLVEEHTGGAFTRYRLRPDVFGPDPALADLAQAG